MLAVVVELFETLEESVCESEEEYVEETETDPVCDKALVLENVLVRVLLRLAV